MILDTNLKYTYIYHQLVHREKGENHNFCTSLYGLVDLPKVTTPTDVTEPYKKN